jgi:hypothetical protein
MEKLSPEERKSLARNAAKQRWENARGAGIQVAGQTAPYESIILEKTEALPLARWPGILSIGTSEVPCYVLEDGRRVITRTAATSVLTDDKGGGQLEKYVMVENLRGFVPAGFKDQMIEFYIPGVSAPNTTTRGISAENFVEICQAYVAAFQADALTTDRQKEIAIKAAMFLAACAKVGLIAMIGVGMLPLGDLVRALLSSGRGSAGEVGVDLPGGRAGPDGAVIDREGRSAESGVL